MTNSLRDVQGVVGAAAVLAVFAGLSAAGHGPHPVLWGVVALAGAVSVADVVRRRR